RPLLAEPPPVEPGAAAALGPPPPARAEVAYVPELDLVHAGSRRDRNGDREEGKDPLRVDRAVDRVDDDPEAAVAERALAELLRDEGEVDPIGVKRLEPRNDSPLGRLVDRGRLVPAGAGSHRRLTIGPPREHGQRS